MPIRNTVKEFAPHTAYHVYNRGVDKRIIFEDERDYAVFLSLLKYALLSDENIKKDKSLSEHIISDDSRYKMRRLGLAGEIELLSFCLMPNHFHLLLYQHNKDALTRLMRSVATAYSMYFNRRHDRKGTLFESTYKAKRIIADAYWLHISRYIHLNAVDLGLDFKTYSYSSYRYYAKKARAEWVNTDMILEEFAGSLDYEKFHDEYISKHREMHELKSILAN